MRCLEEAHRRYHSMLRTGYTWCRGGGHRCSSTHAPQNQWHHATPSLSARGCSCPTCDAVMQAQLGARQTGQRCRQPIQARLRHLAGGHLQAFQQAARVGWRGVCIQCKNANDTMSRGCVHAIRLQAAGWPEQGRALGAERRRLPPFPCPPPPNKRPADRACPARLSCASSCAPASVSRRQPSKRRSVRQRREAFLRLQVGHGRRQAQLLQAAQA